MQKLENYGINRKNLSWFKSYLTNRKQYIQYDSNCNNNDINNDNSNNNKKKNINSNFEKTELLDIIYGVPQGSILGPLYFMLSINDLCFVSQFLKPIMFADDTNLFCSKNNKNKTVIFESNFGTWKNI